jgi:hypothetical protein
MIDKLNAREQLEAASHWLGYHDENLSYGLKSPEDGLKLWRYGHNHPELAEMCDEPEGDDADWTDAHFKAAIGYNPFKRAAALT